MKAQRWHLLLFCCQVSRCKCGSRQHNFAKNVFEATSALTHCDLVWCNPMLMQEIKWSIHLRWESWMGWMRLMNVAYCIAYGCRAFYWFCSNGSVYSLYCICSSSTRLLCEEILAETGWSGRFEGRRKSNEHKSRDFNGWTTYQSVERVYNQCWKIERVNNIQLLYQVAEVVEFILCSAPQQIRWNPLINRVCNWTKVSKVII